MESYDLITHMSLTPSHVHIFPQYLNEFPFQSAPIVPSPSSILDHRFLSPALSAVCLCAYPILMTFKLLEALGVLLSYFKATVE